MKAKILVAAVVSVTTANCSRPQPKLSSEPNPVKEYPVPYVTAEDFGTLPHYSHGYNGDTPAFQLVDQLATEHSQKVIKEKYAVTDAELEQWRKQPPSLIYSGKLLALDGCSQEKSKGAKHLAEIWTQEYLLKLFSHKDIDWFVQAMKSLQEEDSRAMFRPRNAVHPTLIARLGNGIDPKRWILNAIRIRIADRGTTDIGEGNKLNEITKSKDDPGNIRVEDLPPDAVLAQIKLNYELDLFNSTADKSIRFFANIYSLAILPSSVDEFTVDALRISQDPKKSGCDLLDLLNKYARNLNLPEGATPRSSFFFMHTNSLDKSKEVDEWRFAELKPVTNDSIEYGKRAEMEKRVKENLLNEWMRGRVNQIDFSKGAEDPNFDKIDFSGIAAMLEKLTISGNRHIYGPFDTPAGTNDIERALRIAPMAFPVFVAPSPFSDRIFLANNIPPINMWFSGTIIDQGQNSREGMKMISLLVDPNGKEVPIQHPGRRHEETWTCAQCHARQVSNRLQSLPSQYGALLDVVPFLNFRHIGFGDGGDKNCNAMFGAPREFFQPHLSEYLMEVAGGAKIHDSVTNFEQKGKLEIQEANISKTGGLDYFRCQGNRNDFAEPDAKTEGTK
jgi:hypothetical protein